MASQYHPAHISNKELEQIKDLEENLDKVIVAVEPEPKFATLSKSELASLQNTEKKLGVVMLAYDHG